LIRNKKVSKFNHPASYLATCKILLLYEVWCSENFFLLSVWVDNSLAHYENLFLCKTLELVKAAIPLRRLDAKDVQKVLELL
jgi:hypothetical protein